MKKTLIGECIAEFIGCFILILIGCGAVASSVLAGVDISQWEMSIIWGMAVAIAIYVTGSVSGAHLNPAVTLSLSIHRGFEVKKIVPFIISQILGCFTGAATVYLMFKNLFVSFEASNNIVRNSVDGLQTAGVFSTYPHASLSNFDAFLVEMLITMFLVLVILALGDENNSGRPSSNLNPLFIGITIAIIGSAFGALTGFAMNPARDFGPKLFAMISGWGSFSLGESMYFLVPILAPITGAILAGFIYDNLIKKYLINK